MRNPKTFSLTIALVLAAVVANAGDGVWTTTYSFGGHMTRMSMTLDPVSGRLDAAPLWRGLYASTDGAASWSSSTDHRDDWPFSASGINGIFRGVDGTFYLLSWDGGSNRENVFRSTDHGLTWTTTGAGTSGDLTILGFDPGSALVIYAGNRAGGLFKTTDGAASWSPVGAGLPADEIWALEVDPGTPANVYLGTANNGIYKSTDGGVNFVGINNNVVMTTVADIAVDFSNPDVVYAADRAVQGLFQSVDGGATWALLPPSLGVVYTYQTILAFDPTDSNVLYAPDSAGVWKTTNAGVNWTSYPVPADGGVTVLLVDPVTPSTVYAGFGGDGIWKSVDGGVNWSEAHDGVMARNHPHVRSKSVHFDPSTPGLVYSGADFGGRRSTDNGVSWTRMNFPERYTVFATHPSDPGGVWGMDDNLWRSTDSGVNWSDGSNGAFCCFGEGDVAVHSGDPSTVYVAGNGSGSSPDGVYKTTDGGTTWNQVNNGLPFPAVRTLAVDPADGNVVYAGVAEWSGGASGVWKTTDGGANWFQLGGGLPDPMNPSHIVVHPMDSNLVYLGGLNSNSGVYRSTDGGGSWTQLLPANVSSIAVDPGDTNRIYVADLWNQPGFYRSLDGGATWAAIVDGLPVRPGVTSLAVDPADTDRVLAGTTGGAWEYTFRGTVTLTVTQWGDSGPGTLRDTLNQANQDGVPNVVTFAPWMAGGAFSPSSTLPPLAEGSTTLDGDLDDDCVPDIEISGWMVGDEGIQLFSSNNVVRGLVINSFGHNGLAIGSDYGPPADNNLVVCNYIGTDLSGMGGAGNAAAGVNIRGDGTGNQIGTSALPNVISANGVGIRLEGTTGNVIEGNLIGADATGSGALGNNAGVVLEGTDVGSSNHRIGPDNTIGWNYSQGVRIEDGMDQRYPDYSGLVADATGQFPVLDFSMAAGNYCGAFQSADGQIPLDGSGSPFIESFGARFTGTLSVNVGGDYNFHLSQVDDEARVMVDGFMIVEGSTCCLPPLFDGTMSLGAGDHAIEVIYQQRPGGASFKVDIDGPGPATLSSGGQPGLFGELFQLRIPSEGNTITQNSIQGNQDLGILLGGCGPIANDAGDVDVGPNTRLNSPELTGATDDGGGLYTIGGTAEPDATVELFAVAPDPTGHGEGQFFLASGVATGGVFSIQVSLPGGFLAVTATATDTGGNTSEFSANLGVRTNFLAVTNALDSGPGSLRDAVDQANSDATSTEISIDPGLAGQTIHLLQPLPAITEDKTSIDADLGGDCVPDLELDGSLAGWGDGFWVQSDDNLIRGFVIRSFPHTGIYIDQATQNNVVECNYVGTDMSGTAPAPNNAVGVLVYGSDHTIGPGNVIAYNREHGVSVDDWQPESYPDFQGLVPDYTGVFPVIDFQDDCTAFSSIDGITPLDGSGAPFAESFGARFTGSLNLDQSGDYFLELQNTDDRARMLLDGAVVLGCDGCDPSTSMYLDAGDYSIEIDYVEGCGNASLRLWIDGPGNATLTSGGGQPGLDGEFFHVRVPSERNTITQNSIFDNESLGIGFNCNGCALPNDPGDVDVGPNTMLNFPELVSFTDLGGGSFTVDGTAPPDSTVELFGAAPDPTGHGEGKEYVGATLADPSGNFSLTTSLPAEFDSFTATATDAAGNTSEFSQNLAVKSPDEVNLGTAEGFQGDTIEVPVYVRDLASTPLGVDQPAGNKIQGFTFQVQYQPGSSVQAANAYHSGVTAALSPLFDTFTTTPDTVTYVVSFDETTNLVPLTLDGPGPGDEVARLVITIDPGAPPTPIQLTVLNGTTLSNQAGTMAETEGAFLAFGHGSVNVRTRAATSLDATAQSSSDIRLRWNDPQSDETGFRIDRSDDGGGSYSTIATVGPDDTEYFDSGLPSGSLFYYQVTATNGGADAPPSNLAWAETFPATAAVTCVTQVSDDHSWARFPSAAHNGTLWATAYQERVSSTNDEIFFQFLDSWGNPAGSAVRITDHDMRSQYPALRWNGSNFGMIWSEDMRGPNGEIRWNSFFALLDANAQIVRNGVRLLDTSVLGGLNSDLHFTLEWDGTSWGHFAADYFNPPSTNVGYWRFREDGELLTGPVQVSSTGGREEDVTAAWSGSEYGVAWQHYFGDSTELLFQRMLGDGTLLGGPVTVWQSAPGEWGQYTSVEWNGAGWAVAWTVAEADGNWRIYLRLLDASGTPSGPVKRLSHDYDPDFPGEQRWISEEDPELLALPGGGYVCYTLAYSFHSGEYEIARYEADANGDRVGQRTFVSDQDGAISAWPRVATDGSEELVVWNENRQGSLEIGGALVASDGSVTSGPNDLSCCHSPGSSYWFQSIGNWIVVPYLGGFLNLWTDAAAGPWQIYGQIFDSDGNPSTGSFLLSGRDVRGLPAAEGLGDTFAVAWKDSANTVIFDRHQEGVGSLLGEVEVAHDTGGRRGAALAWSGELYGLAYFDGNDVVLQRLDLGGGLAGAPTMVAANGRSNLQARWTGAGWALMWRGPDALYYALVDLYGTVTVPETVVLPNPASWFHFLWNGDVFGLVWREDRGLDPEGTETYFNVLDLSGTPTLPDVLVLNPYYSGGWPQLYWQGDRFHLVRGGGADGSLSEEGMHEDEILPDGTLIPNVRQLSNRGAPGWVAWNGTTAGFLWNQNRELYFQTTACLDDATPPECPAMSVATSDTAVELDWNGVDDPESTIWRYNLYRDGYMLAELFPQTLHYSDGGYRQDSVHDYEVRAFNGAYQESQSCPVETYSTTVGDGNGDGVTDAADIFYLIQYLYAGGPPPQGDADANGDDALNAGDVFYLINHVFGGGPPPIPLVPGGPADVLALGTVEADAGATVEVPVYVRDLGGTPLGGGGAAIQGFAFRVDFPAKAIASASFVQAGVTAGKTPLFPVVQAASDHLVVLMKFARSSDPLELTADAPAPGDLVGHLRLELAAGLADGTIELALDGAATLVDDDATVAESPSRGTLELVDGAVEIGDPSIFSDGFESGDTTAWSSRVGG